MEAIIGPDGAQAFQEVCPVRSRPCMWLLFNQLSSREQAIAAVCSCMSCHQKSICADVACTLSVGLVQSWPVLNLSRLWSSDAARHEFVFVVSFVCGTPFLSNIPWTEHEICT